jgi:hypothetical protein
MRFDHLPGLGWQHASLQLQRSFGWASVTAASLIAHDQLASAAKCAHVQVLWCTLSRLLICLLSP